MTQKNQKVRRVFFSRCSRVYFSFMQQKTACVIVASFNFSHRLSLLFPLNTFCYSENKFCGRIVGLGKAYTKVVIIGGDLPVQCRKISRPFESTSGSSTNQPPPSFTAALSSRERSSLPAILPSRSAKFSPYGKHHRPDGQRRRHPERQRQIVFETARARLRFSHRSPRSAPLLFGNDAWSNSPRAMRTALHA